MNIQFFNKSYLALLLYNSNSSNPYANAGDQNNQQQSKQYYYTHHPEVNHGQVNHGNSYPSGPYYNNNQQHAAPHYPPTTYYNNQPVHATPYYPQAPQPVNVVINNAANANNSNNNSNKNTVNAGNDGNNNIKSPDTPPLSLEECLAKLPTFIFNGREYVELTPKMVSILYPYHKVTTYKEVENIEAKEVTQPSKYSSYNPHHPYYNRNHYNQNKTEHKSEHIVRQKQLIPETIDLNEEPRKKLEKKISIVITNFVNLEPWNLNKFNQQVKECYKNGYIGHGYQISLFIISIIVSIIGFQIYNLEQGLFQQHMIIMTPSESFNLGVTFGLTISITSLITIIFYPNKNFYSGLSNQVIYWTFAFIPLYSFTRSKAILNPLMKGNQEAESWREFHENQTSMFGILYVLWLSIMYGFYSDMASLPDKHNRLWQKINELHLHKEGNKLFIPKDEVLPFCMDELAL